LIRSIVAIKTHCVDTTVSFVFQLFVGETELPDERNKQNHSNDEQECTERGREKWNLPRPRDGSSPERNFQDRYSPSTIGSLCIADVFVVPIVRRHRPPAHVSVLCEQSGRLTSFRRRSKITNRASSHRQNPCIDRARLPPDVCYCGKSLFQCHRETCMEFAYETHDQHDCLEEEST
jgi:hypothetical protein